MMTTEPLLIRGARLVDPSTGMDMLGDILIVEGTVQRAGPTIRNGDLPPGCRVIEADGLLACPGFIDLHVHFREPGYEDKETIATGSLAAARGGFTTVCCMPNTDPAMDNASVVDYVLRRAREADLIRVLTIGCVTKAREGKELAELWELSQAGVVGFSDDGSPVADPNLMRQALAYSSSLGLPIIQHAEDPNLSQNAPVNEGELSNRLGVRGWPAAAEETMVARDISLAQLTGGRLHLAHLSTARSVDLVRKAKEQGLPITAEVAPHHLTLNERWVQGHDEAGALSESLMEGPLTLTAYDTNAKVNPPLRTERDVRALIAGLQDGTIDAIATDHAPHVVTDKLVTLDDAAFGISGLETALAALMGLVHQGDLTLNILVERLTAGPAKLLGERYASLGTLREGAPADVVLINPDREWIVKGEEFASKGKNTPLEGVTLHGMVVATISGGRIVHSATADGQLAAVREASG